MDTTTEARTLRLPADKAAELKTVARVEGMSVSKTVAAAIDDYIAARRKDSKFKQRVKKIMDEDRAILERLA